MGKWETPKWRELGEKVPKTWKGTGLGEQLGWPGLTSVPLCVVRSSRRYPERFLEGSHLEHLEVLRISGLSTRSSETWTPKEPSRDVLD